MAGSSDTNGLIRAPGAGDIPSVSTNATEIGARTRAPMTHNPTAPGHFNRRGLVVDELAPRARTSPSRRLVRWAGWHNYVRSRINVDVSDYLVDHDVGSGSACIERRVLPRDERA